MYHQTITLNEENDLVDLTPGTPAENAAPTPDEPPPSSSVATTIVDPGNNLLTLAKIYVIADTYDVQALKDLVANFYREKANSKGSQLWNSASSVGMYNRIGSNNENCFLFSSSSY